MGRYRKSGVWLALLLVISPAWAQVDDEDLMLVYGDEQTISTATGATQQLRRAPAVATVITADEIAAMGAIDLDEVLETVPGIHVTNAPNTYSSMYLIRGLNSAQNPQVLMLENGVPMTTLFQGNKGTIWGGYPVQNIARIEVIRGPGSALYGADAFAGVINIITKSASDIGGTKAGVSTGSFNTRSAWIQHGSKIDGVTVAAYLNVGRTDGQRRTIEADAQTARDRLTGTRASLAPGPVNVGYDSVDGHFTLGLGKWLLNTGYKLRDNLGTGAGISSALDPIGKEKSERINTDLSWTDPRLNEYWGTGVRLSLLTYKQRVTTDLRLYPAGARFPTGAFPEGMIGHPDTSERQIRLSGFVTYSGIEGHTLRAGIGHDDLNVYDTTTIKNYMFDAAGVPVPVGPVADYSSLQPFMEPQRRQVNYVYLQDEWSLARDWTLTTGLRHDRYSDFGSTTNPRIALVWDASFDVTAKLLYGKAFRAPSFSEQHSVNNPVQRGNASLSPEKISTLEAAVTWQAARHLRLDMSVYRYESDQLIKLTPNSTSVPGSSFANSGRVHGEGAEVEAVWDISKGVRLTMNHAVQKTIDEATGRDDGYAPRQQTYARLDWRIAAPWMASVQVNRVADRRRATGDNRPPVPDYHTADLSLRSNFGKGRWDVQAAIKNLFNADVREPSPAPGLIPFDLPMPGRSLYLQASYQF